MQLDENTQLVKPAQVWELLVHILLVVLSVVVTLLLLVGAGFAGNGLVLLPWTLLAPAVGAGLAIVRRIWRALAGHGAILALNLALPFVLF